MKDIQKTLYVADSPALQKPTKENWQECLIDIFSKSDYFSNEEHNEQIPIVFEILTNFAAKKIYKYQAAFYSNDGNNRDLQNLSDNKMWLSVPKHFNDPFDCQINPRSVVALGILSDADIKQRYDNSIEDRKSIENVITEQSKKLSGFMDSLRQKISVACFSEINDSILMWGHYANGHRGICIEYNLFDFIEKLDFSPLPVVYSEYMAPYEGEISSNNTFAYYFKSLYRKATEWSYEKEWRIIREDDVCGENWKGNGALLKSVKPAGLYLGCQANDKLQNDVKSLSQEIDCPLMQMRIEEGEFKLSPERII